ncbi:hypothetical protein CHUAL_013141 [Chamberlinius hualienensis]
MADHTELISELPQVEKMTTQERLKHARKRRMQQLKKWSQREKEYYRDSNSKKKRTDVTMKKSKKVGCQIHFVPSVMMLESAARGDVDEVQQLLMMGVDPDSTNEDGLTALHQCCIDNNEEMMKLLIEFGANVNAEDSERWTPLHAAATCGHLSLVKYLISKGANLLAVNADGNMPYDICEDETTLDYIESEMSRRGVTQELIDDTRGAVERTMLNDLKWTAQHNGDLENRDGFNASPLHIAAANGYLSVVEFLLEHNVSTDVVDGDLWQPIHAAACWGHLDVLEVLVQNGASLDAKTKNGETPFDICEDIEMKERMMQIKNEMEIKKSTQTQRLKRSQSQNTRSQSVRRTSIRDKTHMTRKEALDEAKMRLEHQSIDVEMTKSQDADKENNGNVDSPVVTVSVNGKPKKVMPVAPLTKHTDSPLNNTERDRSEPIVSSKNRVEVTSAIPLKEIVNVGDSLVMQNGKQSVNDSEAPVTVNSGNGSYPVMNNGVVITNGQNGHGSINNNTLSELKKQRQDLRQRNKPSDPVTEIPDTSVILNGHSSSDHKKERPQGVTSADEVDRSKQKLNCCTIV